MPDTVLKENNEYDQKGQYIHQELPFLYFIWNVSIKIND